MIPPPPGSLKPDEIARLELVALPGSEDIEATVVYRFEDSGEFVVEDEELASEIRDAFPGARIRICPEACLSWEEIKVLAEKYRAQLGGMEEFGISELMYKDQFWRLVQSALDRNTPLTYEEVREAFPNAAWEE